MATTTTTNPTLGEVLDSVDVDGDVDTVRRYIDGGGDPNVACRGRVRTPQQTTYFEGETILMVAAMAGRVDVIRMLLQAGADVNITRPALSSLEEEEGNTESALTLALANGHPETAQYLLDHGADRTTFHWMTDDQSTRNLMDHRILRMYFLAGVDISARNIDDYEIESGTYEGIARRRLAGYTDSGTQPNMMRRYAKVVEVLDGVRLAGSYREFILRDYKQLLRMRSLLARSRATIKSKHPVIARLFGGTVTTSHGSPKERFAGVPDPILWKVLEYYRLGDWRRPCTLPDPSV